MRQARRHDVGDHLDFACNNRSEHGRGAAIGHVHDVHAGFELEHFEQQVGRGAESLRAPDDLAGIGFGIGHNVGQ